MIKQSNSINPKIKIDKQGLSENRYTRGNDAWAAANLVEYTKEKEYNTFKLPLAAIDLSTMPFCINDIYTFVYHCDRVKNADLQYPIILDDYGYVADGWHRIVKAIVDGNTEIDAIRLNEMPLPDGYKDLKNEN